MVEDSADDAELLLYALRDAPFKFTSVRVETEAEYDAALAKALPDVVLCDYNLPRFSSERALKILTERGLDVPFIVISHHIGEDAAVAAMQEGASDYLLKSRLGRLSTAIAASIERRESRQQKARSEQALRVSEAMTRGILNSLTTRIAVLDGKGVIGGILNSLTTRIAVLDGKGVIVATNKAWDNFGDSRVTLDKEAATVGHS